MTCAEFEDLILDRIDGSVSADQAALLRDHLAVCENCRSFESVQRELDSALLSIEKPPAPGRLAQRVRGRIQPRRSLPLVTWDLAGLAAIAAAGAFCVLHWAPNLLLGGPWVAAGVILCAGATLIVADPET